MRGIQVATDLLKQPTHPLIVDTLCRCITDVLTGALSEEVHGGWGFFTLRKLHIMTINMLNRDEMLITSGLDELHRLLEQIVTLKC